MSDDADRIVIGSDGTFRPETRALERRLREHAGTYRLVFDVPGVLVCRREGARGNEGRVLMAGEILSRMTVIEVVNILATFNWRGELHVLGPTSTRILSFDQGALKNAKSTDPDDRLGEVLYRWGATGRDEVRELLDDPAGEVRLAQHLLEKGVLTEEALYGFLQKQAEQIFYSALLVAEGTYVFRLPGEAEGTAGLTLHLPVQHLLMEGVQRVDEMALFRERIPSSALCPEPKAGADASRVDGALGQVLALCNGQRNIDEIARRAALDEFNVTKAIYQLLQQGIVVLRASAAVDPEAVRWLVEQFNEVMRDVFVAVATYGGIDRTRATLAQWLQGSGYARFLGTTVDEDGSIDAQATATSLAEHGGEHPLELLHQALHELAAFALFAATTSLPRDQELLLSRDVNRRLKSIRLGRVDSRGAAP